MSKILVIDDEPWLREMVRLALERQGFEVIEAEDGVRGAQLAQEHRPDLVLCDINMAGKSDAGFVTLAKLRENPVTAATPFILMTGMADNAGMRHGMSLGADDYLPKPFKVDELYATVNARLRKVQTVRAEAEQKLTLLRSQISLMMPHEMRTPLNGILAYGEILMAEAASLKPGEISEMGQVIAESGKRLHRLIENFLILAQLEIAAGDPQKITALRAAKSFHPADLVRGAVTALASQAGRSADLALALNDVSVAMAPDYFQKIVAELVQNAFKFSKPGQRVQVGLAAAGGSVALSVSDAGNGFTAEQISRVGAYLQFDRNMEDRQGLGLGLAIAKQLAELHQGSLAITHTPGGGATVTVKLPASA
jgi:signal transduction histidine kinase